MRAVVLAVAAATVALVPARALALLARVTVSAARGNDADPNCGSAASPCRSLQTAHDRVADGGEIDILDPGGYGAVTIGKSVSIVNDGVGVAGSLAASGNGVTIDAGPKGVVTIKGLTLNGGAFGVNVVSAARVVLSNLDIRNFAVGVGITPTTDLDFTITDTSTFNNSIAGFVIRNSNGVVIRGSVSQSVAHLSPFGFGLSVDNAGSSAGRTNVTVEDSAFDHDRIGVYSAHGAELAARRVDAAHNGAGFVADVDGKLSLDDCVAFDNGVDLTNEGSLTSFKNNQFATITGTIANEGLR